MHLILLLRSISREVWGMVFNIWYTDAPLVHISLTCVINPWPFFIKRRCGMSAIETIHHPSNNVLKDRPSYFKGGTGVWYFLYKRFWENIENIVVKQVTNSKFWDPYFPQNRWETRVICRNLKQLHIKENWGDLSF